MNAAVRRLGTPNSSIVGFARPVFDRLAGVIVGSLHQSGRLMRHSSWLKVESSAVLYPLYEFYRKVPPRWRVPVRWALLPHWSLMTAVVRTSARQRVLAGPFAGTRLFVSEQTGRLLPCYYLGTAELEIQDAVESLIARRYATVLNIGAADGYYAVGLARRLPKARVIAFEAVDAFRPVLERTAAANGVAHRIEIKGHCDRGALRAALAGAELPILVVSDVEGYETELLDPAAIPELKGADLLIETHDASVRGCTEIMTDRFRATHAVERFVGQPRELDDLPARSLPLFRKLFPKMTVELMNERRAGIQQWLCCRIRPDGPAKISASQWGGSDRAGERSYCSRA
ncbi:MAG TPA: hypothetical protein VGG01_04070 [Xanthobacteraceae bacterium]